MGTSKRRKTNKKFSGSKLVVPGQGNSGISRSNIQISPNITKNPNSEPEIPPSTT